MTSIRCCLCGGKGHSAARCIWKAVALLLLPLAAAAGLPAPGTPGAPKDSRYCGEPARDSEGRIKRDRSVLREFAATWPCPSTGWPSAVGCRGWQIDHVIPLAAGGCDMGHNLQWLPLEIKTCAADTCKDRWERKVYRS